MDTARLDLPLTVALSQLQQAHAEPQSLLTAIAQHLGTRLNVDACLLASAPTHDAMVGVWCADGLASERTAALAQLHANCTVSQPARGTPPLRRLLRVPLPSGGVLLAGKQATRDWAASARARWQEASALADLLVANTQLQQRLVASQGYQQLFQDLSRALHNTTALDALLQVALAGTAQALTAERSAIVTLKYRDPLSARADDTPDARVALLKQWTAAVPPFPAAEFALVACPYCTAAWRQAPHPLTALATAAPSPFLSLTEQFPHWMIQPLIHAALPTSRPLVLGFLVLQSSRPSVWQPAERELVAGVGLQVSAAIVRDRALQRVQSVVDERTAQLKGSLEMQAKLYEKSRQQVKQLRQLLAAKSEFLDAVSHELRTPLTTMKMAIQVLRQPSLPAERHAQYLDLLEQEWQREYNLIQDLLALQKLESNQVEFDLQRFDFKTLLNALAEQFRQKWQSKGLTLAIEYAPLELGEPEKPLLLYSDADSLQQTLQELLTNAGKYSHPETTVTVSIDRTVPNHQLTLSVTNLGRRISQAEQETIFEKFMRGQGATDEAIPGTGLGLALVKGLVQHLDGTIEVESQGAAGDRAAETRFTLTLPPPPPLI